MSKAGEMAEQIQQIADISADEFTDILKAQRHSGEFLQALIEAEQAGKNRPTMLDVLNKALQGAEESPDFAAGGNKEIAQCVEKDTPEFREIALRINERFVSDGRAN